jgi:clan AA aspartic protease
VVDTGFNDWLTLPPWVIERLQLQMRQGSIYLLADGTESRARTFVAEVEWLGQWREIFVVEIESNPLLGMMMMEGHYLGIQVVAGGRVEITPLQS